MHLVGHVIARHETAAGGMARHYNQLEIREVLLARELAQDLVGEIVGGERRIIHSGAAAAPVVAGARPVELVFSQRILALAAVGRKARRNHDRVVERVGEERRRARRAEIIVAIARAAVDHDQRTSNGFVALVQRVGRVDQEP